MLFSERGAAGYAHALSNQGGAWAEARSSLAGVTKGRCEVKRRLSGPPSRQSPGFRHGRHGKGDHEERADGPSLKKERKYVLMSDEERRAAAPGSKHRLASKSPTCQASRPWLPPRELYRGSAYAFPVLGPNASWCCMVDHRALGTSAIMGQFPRARSAVQRLQVIIHRYLSTRSVSECPPRDNRVRQ